MLNQVQPLPRIHNGSPRLLHEQGKGQEGYSTKPRIKTQCPSQIMKEQITTTAIKTIHPQPCQLSPKLPLQNQVNNPSLVFSSLSIIRLTRFRLTPPSGTETNG